MKAVGMLFMVLAAFALGLARRRDKLMRERVLSELAALVSAYRVNAEYEHDSALVCLQKLSLGERAESLDFLQAALQDAQAGELLGEALNHRFLEWRSRDALSASLCAEISEFFGGVATASKETELSRCDYVSERIAEELLAVRRENAQRRGYYETVYTLAGAAAAVALM